MLFEECARRLDLDGGARHIHTVGLDALRAEKSRFKINSDSHLSVQL